MLGTLPSMFVSDLTHFLDLPEDVPGPARRMAEHLGDIVRSATAGDAGPGWTSALPCRRRPGRRPCPGRIVVRRLGPPAPIQWQCSVCHDQGVISNWEDSPYDLRPRRLQLAEPPHEIVIPTEVAAVLRRLELLDDDAERLVFRSRSHPEGAALTITADDLDHLLGFVAAEADHTPNRRRQQRLDAAFAVLNDALGTVGR